MSRPPPVSFSLTAGPVAGSARSNPAELHAYVSLMSVKKECRDLMDNSWPDADRCTIGKGHRTDLVEREPLFQPDAYRPECNQCLISGNGNGPIDYRVSAKTLADIGAKQLEGCKAVRERWTTAANAMIVCKEAHDVAQRPGGLDATKVRTANELVRCKIEERTAFLEYAGLCYDIIRKRVLPGTGEMRSEHHDAYLAFLSQYSVDHTERSGGNPPLVYCFMHNQRAAHLVPFGGSFDAYNPECWMCPLLQNHERKESQAVVGRLDVTQIKQSFAKAASSSTEQFMAD